MKGKKAVFESLNIEASEIVPVMLLIAQSVFLGIFYGTFDIGAHTLFLKTYPEEMIPKAYIISGIAGILLTSSFSKFQSKIKFSKLATFTLLFISLTTILIRIFFEVTLANWTVFLVFILLGPLNILALLAFWGTVSRIFNLRQGKRLFGIIDSGQVFGIIISSYAIPLILTYLQGTKNLLLISAISIVCAMLIEMIISKKYKLDDEELKTNNIEKSEKIAHEQVKLKNFAKDPYIRYMAFFVIFSMFAAFFVQYSFLVVTNEQYPIEEELAKYLGFFTGSMMIFTFIIKTFVYSKLMKTYGLKVSLILSPLLLGLFTGIAILVGFFSGYEAGSAGFIYFFLFISLSKLFNKTLKDALEVPAFKLLYQSLKKAIRFDVQAKIDGTINEIAALVSGLLLSILGILAFINLIHFSVFLFTLLGIWTFITVKLYKEYRNSLEKSLQEGTGDTDIGSILNERKKLPAFTNSFNEIRKLKLIEKYLPGIFLKEIKLKFNSSETINFNEIDNDFFVELILLFLRSETSKEWDSIIKKSFKFDSDKVYSANEISELIKSGQKQNIATGLNYIFNLKQKERLTLLWALLRVPDNITQKYAIRLCGTLKETETLNTLIEFLESKLLMSYSLISIKEMSEDSAKQLIQMFYKSDITLISQLAILEAIEAVDINKTFDFLIENVSSHRKEIVEKSINILKKHDINLEEYHYPKLFHPITVASKTISWDISALASLGQQQESSLYYAIEKEYQKHLTVLMDLLSITYDAKSVMHVQEHLNSGTSEGIGYALELFDLFLSEEIKPMILSIFEDISLVEKSRLLEAFFPVEVTTIDKLIIDIINRDPNLISNETKKIALTNYQNYYNEVTNDLIAHLFNPVQEIQETAALIINKLNKNLFKRLKTRLNPKVRYSVEKSVNEKHEQRAILEVFNENQHLNKVLKIIKNNEVVEIADYLSINLMTDPKIKGNNEFVNNYFVFLITNLIDLTHDETIDSLIFEGFVKNDNIIFDENKYVIGIKKERMDKLILTHADFIQNLINTL